MPLFRRRVGTTEPEPPPGPVSREEVVGRLLSAAPVAGPVLAGALLAAVRYATKREPDAGIDVGRSKFGGAPDLPLNTRWPHWTPPGGERRPLHFFAQIELASATAAAPGPLGLPAEGLLSFFADFDTEAVGILGLYPWEREGSTVLYSPDQRLSRYSPRRPPLPSGQLVPLGAWTWPSVGAGVSVVPAAEIAALDALDQVFEADLRAQVPEGCQVAGRHQLGGHGRFIRTPVEEGVVQALAGCFSGAGGFDSAAWEGARSQVADWRVILQLDSDESLEVRWGDVGTLWWAARHADVAAGNWELGMFNFQCP